MGISRRRLAIWAASAASTLALAAGSFGVALPANAKAASSASVAAPAAAKKSSAPKAKVHNYKRLNKKAKRVANKKNAKKYGIHYVIFRQKIWTTQNPRWRKMANRGGATANHFDHVHISVKR